MLTRRLWATLPASDSGPQWKNLLARYGLIFLYVLMTVQFVGCYLYNTFPYLDLNRFAHGYERLPFQTRLLLAPLFRWSLESPFMLHYSSDLARNTYFFPVGIPPTEVVEFFLDIPCLLIAGWVAVQIYKSASRRRLLDWLVYPLFMVLCTVSYVLHTVQNFRFVYDIPSLMFFSLGFYIIYFRKPVLWLVALFALATLNRETTLFLLPFYLLSEWVRGRRQSGTGTGETAEDDTEGTSPERPILVPGPSPWQPSSHTGDQPGWRTVVEAGRHRLAIFLRELLAAPRMLRPEAILTTVLLLAYWAAWHLFVFHVFRHNASEYYSRLPFNLHCFQRLRYYPQLFSACGYLLPFLLLFHRRIRDRQLRAWMLAIPFWYCVMSVWGILVETRVFGELLPFVACAATLIAEELLVAAVRRHLLARTTDEDDRVHLLRAA